MGILIIIVVAMLVVAGIGAGVYVFIFRAKHKKEVNESSQMNDVVPSYGMGPMQNEQTTPIQSTPDSPLVQGQVNSAMNDITGGIPQPPQSQEDIIPESSQDQSTVSRNFPGMSPQTETPLSSDISDLTGNINTPSAPVDTPDLNQSIPGPENSGNLLQDNETIDQVSKMAEELVENSSDSSVTDSTVPITNDEHLGQVESVITDTVAPPQAEEQIEQFEAPQPPDLTTESQVKPSVTPEPSVVPDTATTQTEPISTVQDFPTEVESQPEKTQSEASTVPETPSVDLKTIQPTTLAPKSPAPVVEPVSTEEPVPTPVSVADNNVPQPGNEGGDTQDSGTPEMNI